MDEFQLMF